MSNKRAPGRSLEECEYSGLDGTEYTWKPECN